MYFMQRFAALDFNLFHVGLNVFPSKKNKVPPHLLLGGIAGACSNSSYAYSTHIVCLQGARLRYACLLHRSSCLPLQALLAVVGGSGRKPWKHFLKIIACFHVAQCHLVSCSFLMSVLDCISCYLVTCLMSFNVIWYHLVKFGVTWGHFVSSVVV